MLSFFMYVFIFGAILVLAFLFSIGLLVSRGRKNVPQEPYDPNVIDVKAIDVDEPAEPVAAEPAASEDKPQLEP